MGLPGGSSHLLRCRSSLLLRSAFPSPSEAVLPAFQRLPAYHRHQRVVLQSARRFWLAAAVPQAVLLQSLRRRSGSGRVGVLREMEAAAMHHMSGVEGAPVQDSNVRATVPASSAIQFLTLCQRLKTTKRTGWVNNGVKESESIADHMYRMAVMAIISGDLPGVNKDRCVKMAVVHDIAEAIVGDITPSDGIPKEEKNRLETAAINEMCQLLGGGLEAEEVRELWQEYENNSTPEAKLVKDFDKLEMILQALEYETEQGKELDDFFQSTRGKFQTDLGKAWAAEIVSRRKQKLKEPQEPTWQ